MLNIIDEIIEIDKNARKSVTEAGERAEKIKQNANEQAEKIRQEYNERIEKRLSIVNDNYSKFAEDEIASITAQEKSAIEKLENAMHSNEKTWRTEILARVLGAEGSAYER